MNAVLHLCVALERSAARLTAWLAPPLLLGLRLWVAHAFLVAGWVKLSDWDNTLFLFQEEYHAPLLPPMLAAVMGTTGEILFPLLLVGGLLTRFAALGLSAVNVMAVVSYWHVLGGKGFEAALGQHWLWGLMLVVLVVFGGGRLSLDDLLSGLRGSAKGLPHGMQRSAGAAAG